MAKPKKKNLKKKMHKGGHMAQSPNDSRVEEERLISELTTRTRSLLATLQGVVPDGSPFAIEHHPLAKLHESIFDLTERLMRSQPRLKIVDDPEIWQNFHAWLSQCHIDTSRFPVNIQKLQNESGNIVYGLVATRDIDYNETVLEIPVDSMMSPYWNHSLATDFSPPPPPFDSSRSVDDEALRPLALVTFLMNERYKGASSPYRHYINILPSFYSTPLYWSLESIRGMKRTTHLKRVVTLQALTMWEYLQIRCAFKREHDANIASQRVCRGTLIPVEELTYELFRWATVTAHTRQNLIPFREDTEGIQKAHALVPLWDLINHDDSDRACLTEVVFSNEEETEGKAGGGEENEKIVQQGLHKNRMLICRTPMKFEGSGVCYKCGEEVNMYYGERSNAQLLFHSGFVNGGQKHKFLKSSAADTCARNLNRSDRAVIRLTLPSAKLDKLDKIREMVAARLGFRAYVDQGCEHSGLELAQITAAALNGGEIDLTNKRTASDTRDEGCVVMKELTVSPRNACSIEMRLALLVCLADKDELASLLRSVDKYQVDTASNDTDSIMSEQDFTLMLDARHVRLVSNIVESMNQRYDKSGCDDGERPSRDASLDLTLDDDVDAKEIPLFWTDIREADNLTIDLACCDNITLNLWCNAFQDYVHLQK